MIFGETARCRTCRGTGLSRNPEYGDKDLARQRARQRRAGVEIEAPKAIARYIECAGVGFLPVAIADSPREGRDEFRPSSVDP